jgi:hypothetical protein
MAYVGLLLIIATNCVILYFSAFLAVYGNGSAEGIRAAWLWGYVWIAGCSLTALVLLIRKSKSWFAVAAGTLPAGWAASILAILSAEMLGFHVG